MWKMCVYVVHSTIKYTCTFSSNFVIYLTTHKECAQKTI